MRRPIPRWAWVVLGHAAPRTRADVLADCVELGRRKGNDLPPDLVLADYKAVVIYCKPFHVVFAVAPSVPAN